MTTASRRMIDRPIAPPKPEPISVEVFLMLLDAELNTARGLDQSSIFYEGRRDDAISRITGYFARAKISSLTPLRKELGLARNQLVVPALESIESQITECVAQGHVPDHAAAYWLTAREAPPSEPADTAADTDPVEESTPEP